MTASAFRPTAPLGIAITELPLSYYMLHAYSRLSLVDSGRARIASFRPGWFS